MAFNTAGFLFLFFPAAFLLYRLMPGRRTKNVFLAIASALFYGFGGLASLPVLLAAFLWDYLFGRLIAKDEKRAKLWCGIAAAGNLALLGFYKYLAFVLETLHLPALSQPFALPLGISFFTFHGISYLVDVYREPSRVCRRADTLFLYLAFFPRLIAGPIVRWQDAAAQLAEHPISPEMTAAGLRRLVRGLLKKLLLAESAAAVANQVADQFGWSHDSIEVTTIGPDWGAGVIQASVIALLVSFALIIAYIAIRFEYKMGVCAIIALLHDIIIVVGVYALVGREVTPNAVAALLTILGYSLYDKVVVFHRINENMKDDEGKCTFMTMANRSLNQVIIRTMNTSIAQLVPVIAMLLFVLAVTVGLMAIMSTVGIPILGFLYGLDFSEYRGLSLIMVAAGGVTAAIDFLYQIVTVLRKQGSVMKLYLITFGFSLFIPVLLVGFTGLPGAVIGYLIVMTILLVLLVWEYLRIRMQMSRDRKEAASTAASASASEEPRVRPSEMRAERERRAEVIERRTGKHSK